MSVRHVKPEHEVCYQDLIALVRKHGDKVSSLELLAIAANMLGKILAMQDQRALSKEAALEVIIHNIELGNKQVIDNLLKAKARGTA